MPTVAHLKRTGVLDASGKVARLARGRRPSQLKQTTTHPAAATRLRRRYTSEPSSRQAMPPRAKQDARRTRARTTAAPLSDEARFLQRLAEPDLPPGATDAERALVTRLLDDIDECSRGLKTMDAYRSRGAHQMASKAMAHSFQRCMSDSDSDGDDVDALIARLRDARDAAPRLAAARDARRRGSQNPAARARRGSARAPKTAPRGVSRPRAKATRARAGRRATHS